MPAAHKTTSRPSQPRPLAVRLLADDIRELVAFTGAATEEDLARMGWTPEQLADLLPEARGLLGPASARAA